MKKIIATAAALVLTLAMSVTAFAAPSVTNPSGSANNSASTSGSGSVTNIRNYTPVQATATDANGNPVNITITAFTAEQTVVAQAAVRAAFGENVDVLAAGDYNVEGASESNPITVVFDTNGVNAGDKVYVLHQRHDGAWYKEDATASAGKVTAVFTSFSPMVVVRENATTVASDNDYQPGTYDKYLNNSSASTDTTVSPKTGDNGVTGAILIALACAAGFVVLNRKKLA